LYDTRYFDNDSDEEQDFLIRKQHKEFHETLIDLTIQRRNY